MNIMQQIKVEKVTLNIGTGGPGDKLDKAIKLLKKLTNKKPVPTTTKRRIPLWGLRPGLQIGCKVTLRGKDAEEFVKKILVTKSNKLSPLNFDTTGNVSFGIPEYLDIPDVEYDASIGIIGLEAAITLARPGFRIKLRKLKRKKIPVKHRITKEEAIEFMKTKFNITVGVEEWHQAII